MQKGKRWNKTGEERYLSIDFMSSSDGNCLPWGENSKSLMVKWLKSIALHFQWLYSLTPHTICNDYKSLVKTQLEWPGPGSGSYPNFRVLTYKTQYNGHGLELDMVASAIGYTQMKNIINAMEGNVDVRREEEEEE